jgi:hypothetical protein
MKVIRVRLKFYTKGTNGTRTVREHTETVWVKRAEDAVRAAIRNFHDFSMGGTITHASVEDVQETACTP